MASNLGLEFEADFSMDLFAELTPLTVLQLPETEDDIAMSFTAAGRVRQPDQIPKIEENVTVTPLPMDSITALPLSPNGNFEPLAEITALPPSNPEEPGIQNTDDTSHTEVDVVDFSLISDGEQEPQNFIESEDTVFNMRLMVIVSMVAPFADSAETLIHAGDFIIEVTPTTTIREIKYGITSTLEICYEDMALVFVGKFLSDSRTIEYYLIDDGQTLHLLVESPNKLFKDVFEAFKRLSLSEEKAWFATRSFIHVMHNKYNTSDGFGNDETPALTEELLLHELEQLYVPDSDESDDSSADDDEPNIFNSNVVFVGGMELEFVDDETDEDEDLEEQDNSEYEEQNSEDEEQNSEDGDYNSEDDEANEIDENEEDDIYYLTQVMAHFTPVVLFE